jgi:hypothetical protein
MVNLNAALAVPTTSLNPLDLKAVLVGADVRYPRRSTNRSDYYREARAEFARLYKTHRLNPPGAPAGSHVSLCRDIYRNIDAHPK